MGEERPIFILTGNGPAKRDDTPPDKGSMRERVGIITTFHDSINYGGVLQAYALHTTVQNLGFECDLIRYSRSKQASTIVAVKRGLKRGVFTPEHILRACNVLVRTLKQRFCRLFEMLVWKIYLDQKISLRKDAFSRFSTSHIHSTGPYDDETITECIKNYDIFVCGSDQIWKPGVFTPVYALGFVPDDRRKIAYAPSIGIAHLTDSEIESLKPLVNRLDAISVREERGKELLEMMTTREVHLVLDPTLLLDYTEWKKIIRPYPMKTPYIFCYMLGKNKANKQFVIRIAERLGMPLVTMPFGAGDNYISLIYGDVRVYDADPGEFLGLIQNAEYVITDSFHGSVFSILLRKKFLVLKRSDDDDRSSMNSRVYSLLGSFILEDRLVDDLLSFDPAVLADEIDYESVFVSLYKQRAKSLKYLKEALMPEKGIASTR